MILDRPDFNRVITTLQHEEPDRVPLAEVVIDYQIMSQFLGKKVAEDDLASQAEFWTRAGYDFIPLTVGMMKPGDVTRDSQISQVIQKAYAQDLAGVDDDEWNVLKRSRIHTEEDFDAFPWDEAAKLDFSKFYEVQAYLPEKMKVIAASGKIFTLTWMLMGFENFGINLKLNPRFTSRVIEKVAQIQLDGLRQITRIPNVAAVWVVDDLAFGSGTIINPKAFREFLFPWYEEFSKICRDNGLYLIFHSDGRLWDLIEDLIAIGVDALHPIDPTCMDIEEVKRRVGDRVCLIGNISNEILEIGTPEDVVQLTKKRLREIAPGGGYCLGAGNSVPDWAKIENYRAMIDTCLTYGKYPIKL